MRTWTHALLALLALAAIPAHSADFTERLLDTSTSSESTAWSASGSVTPSGHLDAVSVSDAYSPEQGTLVQLSSGDLVTSIEAVCLTLSQCRESYKGGMLIWTTTPAAESIDRHV